MQRREQSRFDGCSHHVGGEPCLSFVVRGATFQLHVITNGPRQPMIGRLHGRPSSTCSMIESRRERASRCCLARIMLAVIFTFSAVATRELPAQHVGGVVPTGANTADGVVQPASPLDLVYERIDWRVITALDAEGMRAAIAAERQRMVADGENYMGRHESLERIQQFTEVVRQYREQAERHVAERNSIMSQLSQLGIAGPEWGAWEDRLAIARQRWPVVSERLKLVDSRVGEAERDERILADFVADTRSLDRYLAARAERLSLDAERRMLQAELGLLETCLDELPRAIKKARQLGALRQGQVLVTSAGGAVGWSGDGEQISSGKISKEGTASGQDPVTRAPSSVGSELWEKLRQIEVRRGQVRQELEAVRQQLRGIEEKSQTLRDKYERFGLDGGNRLLFLEAHRKLPSEQELRIQDHCTRRELRQLKAEGIAAERLLPLSSDAAKIDIAEGGADRSRASLADLVQLIQGFEDLHQDLIELTSEREKVIQAVESLRSYLDQKLLWVQNADALNTAVLGGCSEGAQSLLQPEPWLGLLQGVVKHLREQPGQVAVWGLGLFGLWWTSRKLVVSRGVAD